LRVSSTAVMPAPCSIPLDAVNLLASICASAAPLLEEPVPRILSGVQPTGNTHLGNYVGASLSGRPSWVLSAERLRRMASPLLGRGQGDDKGLQSNLCSDCHHEGTLALVR
jgi:hypothetical protein